jgi:hypothetical protein
MEPGVFHLARIDNEGGLRMKTIHEDLGRVITDLEVICGTLDSLGRKMEVAPLPVRVDDYYKIRVFCKSSG